MVKKIPDQFVSVTLSEKAIRDEFLNLDSLKPIPSTHIIEDS